MNIRLDLDFQSPFQDFQDRFRILGTVLGFIGSFQGSQDRAGLDSFEGVVSMGSVWNDFGIRFGLSKSFSGFSGSCRDSPDSLSLQD